MEADFSSKRRRNTDIEQVSPDKKEKLRKIQVCGYHLNDATRSCVLWCFV